MPPVSTCLIGQNAFIKEGLKSLLEGTAYDIRGAYHNIGDAREGALQGNAHDVIIIFHESSAGSITDSIKTARGIFSARRIIILVSEIEAGAVIAAFTAGADGCLSHDASPAVLIATLDMVMAGEKVFPSAMLKNFMAGGAETDFGYDLSSREIQVLEYVSAGKTNKEIAKSLDITEATVKVHIKTVLRKLNLSNRTQAAVWAVNKGLAAQVQDHSRMEGA